VYGLNLVILFGKRVRYVKKVKNYWPRPTINHKTVIFFIRSQLKHHLLCINTHYINTSSVHEYQWRLAMVVQQKAKLQVLMHQVCTYHDGCKQGIDQQIFNRKSISSKITHPQSWKLQAKLTGEKLKGWSNSREKTNSRLQSKYRTLLRLP